jgi:hypothetical protein
MLTVVSKLEKFVNVKLGNINYEGVQVEGDG